MRLRHIEVFHAVMQAGSVSGAAELLSISQPAASKMLAQAEASLGTALFVRLPGGLKPTREASLLFSETKIFHASLENVRRLGRNLTAHPGGLLRIGSIPSLGLSLIPQAVVEMNGAHPGISLRIRTDHTEALCNHLLSQDLDIGIAFDPPPRPGIVIQEVGRARAVYMGPALVTSPDPYRPRADKQPPRNVLADRQVDASVMPGTSPADGDVTVSIRQLDMTQCIGLDANDPLGERVVSALRALDGDWQPPTVEVQTYYIARALVERGLGFAIVDEFTAKSGYSSATVREIDPPISVGVCTMYAASGMGGSAREHFSKALARQLTCAAQA